MDPTIVETSCGKVRGKSERGVHIFRGVPYGADTGGAHRFQPAQPISWGGVLDAFDHGPRSPQNDKSTARPYLTWLRDPQPMAENCLALNIFTPSPGAMARLPVMVYIHGGGFAIGSSGAPGLAGNNLAERGVVVVTLNHRLNLFGHLYLGDADGGRYAESGNLGMLDIISALQWVHDNITAFGGNPDLVTLFGQSGGGSKIATLMAMPKARGLFHRAIIQSASSLLRMATLEEADHNTHHFLKALDLDRKQLGALHTLPADKLIKAMVQAVGMTRVDNYRPVVDGHTLPHQPFSAPAVQLSAHIPLMTGWCENEQRLTYAAQPGIYQQSAQDAHASVAHALAVSPNQAAKLVEVYQAGRPLDQPGDILAQIVGDHRYRRNVTLAAEQQLTHGEAPVYMYLLRWKTPVLNGLLRTPHTLCLAFAFANVDLASGITGTGVDRYPLQQAMSEAWLAFARNGNPDHAGLPIWRPYTAADRPTMVFDRQTALLQDPLRDERMAFEPYPRYNPARGEGELRAPGNTTAQAAEGPDRSG